MSEVEFDGIAVKLGRTVYTMPPLNLRSIKTLQPKLDAYTGDIKSVDTVVECAYHALRRNYPDITEDGLLDLVDVGNMQRIMTACMDVSGLTRQQETAAAQSGESLIGTNSTPTS